jgi:hypothetical protein
MRRTVLVVLAAVVAFGAVASIILRFMPRPAGESDYLIAGSVATLVALLVVFLGLVLTRSKSRDVFFKKRPKQHKEP